MKLNKAVKGVVMSVQDPAGSEITIMGALRGYQARGDLSDCVEIQDGGDGYLQGAVYALLVVSSVIDVVYFSNGELSSYVGGGDGYDSNFLLRRDVTGRVCVFNKRTSDSNVDGCRKVTVLLDCGLVGEDKVGRCVGWGEWMKFVDGIKDEGTPGLLRYCYTAGGAVDWDGTATNVVDDVGANVLYYNCNRIVEGRPHLAILLRGTVAVVLDGLRNCKCRGEAAEHYWLGAGKCKECLHSFKPLQTPNDFTSPSIITLGYIEGQYQECRTYKGAHREGSTETQPRVHKECKNSKGGHAMNTTTAGDNNEA
eukprot:scaffold9977_cov68-Cyclotella_meneghiniana.AAC.1